MNRVFIIHGCPSDEERAMNPETRTYDKHWIPWTKRELMRQGYEVIAPLMPNPWAPDYAAFKEAFDKNMFSENDVFIGHSCGCAFLVRWLGDTGQKIAKLILIAPWKVAEEGDVLREKFYGYSIDETIPQRVGAITIFTSNDEEHDGKKSAKIFHDVLGGKVVKLQNHGHYVIDEMGTEEFPELIDEVVG